MRRPPLAAYLLRLLTFMTPPSQAKELGPALLGVNLGSTFITASYFNASGPVPLARLRGSDAYHSFMMSTLPGGAYEGGLETAKEILNDTLSSITNEARAITGDFIRIGAISFPAHLKGLPRQAVFAAGHEFDPNLNHQVQYRPSHYGAMLTYPPGYCLESWGQDLSYWDGGDDVYITMFEHDFGSLRITLAAVGRGGTGIEQEDRLAWPTNQTTLENIIRKQVKPIYLSDIAAVVISSDDPATDLSLVPAAIAATFPELSAKIQNPVGGTHFVTSVGAACVARQIALIPGVVHQDGAENAPGHDEL